MLCDIVEKRVIITESVISNTHMMITLYDITAVMHLILLGVIWMPTISDICLQYRIQSCDASDIVRCY